MPRIIQLTPDGGGRYIAVDREGTSGGARRNARRAAARSTSRGSRYPRSSRGTTHDRHRRRPQRAPSRPRAPPWRGLLSAET